MRLFVVPWLVFAAGCATTGQATAARHEALRLEPQDVPLPVPPPVPLPKPRETTVPEAPPEASTEEAKSEAQAAAMKAGPWAGRVAIRTILLGAGLNPGASLVPTFGLRLFVMDQMALNARVGVGLVSEKDVVQMGYQAGLGASLYTRSDGAPGVYPYFEGEATLSRTETKERNSTVLSLSVGFGLDAWIAPYVSTGALLRVGFASDFTNETFAVGTINPGAVITIYLK